MRQETRCRTALTCAGPDRTRRAGAWLAAAFAGLFLLLAAPAGRAEPLPVGKGQFDFVDDAVAPGKRVTVWYDKPADLGPDARVVFVMHGVDRDAKRYRDDWARYAERYKFLLLAPEFSKQSFSTAAYQFGNVADPNRAHWTFWIIEHLFDDMRRREALQAAGYALYGHSAGAQFVHRLMLFLPETRAEVAVAANSGTYTMPYYPTPSQPAFPMALDRQRVDEAQLASALFRHLVVMQGEEDVSETGKNVPQSRAAEAQGKNRLERGLTFFSAAQAQAAALGVPLRWERVTVPGVGHSDVGMSKAAVRYLLAWKPATGN